MEDFSRKIDDYREHARLLKALAHPVRLCIVRGLMQDEGCNVSKMQGCLDVPQSTLSQHLAKLRNLNILESRRDGVERNYYVVSDEARKVVKALYYEFEEDYR